MRGSQRAASAAPTSRSLSLLTFKPRHSVSKASAVRAIEIAAAAEATASGRGPSLPVPRLAASGESEATLLNSTARPSASSTQRGLADTGSDVFMARTRDSGGVAAPSAGDSLIVRRAPAAAAQRVQVLPAVEGIHFYARQSSTSHSRPGAGSASRPQPPAAPRPVAVRPAAASTSVGLSSALQQVADQAAKREQVQAYMARQRAERVAAERQAAAKEAAEAKRRAQALLDARQHEREQARAATAARSQAGTVWRPKQPWLSTAPSAGSGVDESDVVSERPLNPPSINGHVDVQAVNLPKPSQRSSVDDQGGGWQLEHSVDNHRGAHSNHTRLPPHPNMPSLSSDDDISPVGSDHSRSERGHPSSVMVLDKANNSCSTGSTHSVSPMLESPARGDDDASLHAPPHSHLLQTLPLPPHQPLQREQHYDRPATAARASYTQSPNRESGQSSVGGLRAHGARRHSSAPETRQPEPPAAVAAGRGAPDLRSLQLEQVAALCEKVTALKRELAAMHLLPAAPARAAAILDEDVGERGEPAGPQSRPTPAAAPAPLSPGPACVNTSTAASFVEPAAAPTPEVGGDDECPPDGGAHVIHSAAVIDDAAGAPKQFPAPESSSAAEDNVLEDLSAVPTLEVGLTDRPHVPAALAPATSVPPRDEAPAFAHAPPAAPLPPPSTPQEEMRAFLDSMLTQFQPLEARPSPAGPPPSQLAAHVHPPRSPPRKHDATAATVPSSAPFAPPAAPPPADSPAPAPLRSPPRPRSSPPSPPRHYVLEPVSPPRAATVAPAPAPDPQRFRLPPARPPQPIARTLFDDGYSLQRAISAREKESAPVLRAGRVSRDAGAAAEPAPAAPSAAAVAVAPASGVQPLSSGVAIEANPSESVVPPSLLPHGGAAGPLPLPPGIMRGSEAEALVNGVLGEPPPAPLAPPPTPSAVTFDDDYVEPAYKPAAPGVGSRPASLQSQPSLRLTPDQLYESLMQSMHALAVAEETSVALTALQAAKAESAAAQEELFRTQQAQAQEDALAIAAQIDLITQQTMQRSEARRVAMLDELRALHGAHAQELAAAELSAAVALAAAQQRSSGMQTEVARGVDEGTTAYLAAPAVSVNTQTEEVPAARTESVAVGTTPRLARHPAAEESVGASVRSSPRSHALSEEAPTPRPATSPAARIEPHLSGLPPPVHTQPSLQLVHVDLGAGGTAYLLLPHGSPITSNTLQTAAAAPLLVPVPATYQPSSTDERPPASTALPPPLLPTQPYSSAARDQSTAESYSSDGFESLIDATSAAYAVPVSAAARTASIVAPHSANPRATVMKKPVVRATSSSSISEEGFDTAELAAAARSGRESPDDIPDDVELVRPPSVVAVSPVARALGAAKHGTSVVSEDAWAIVADTESRFDESIRDEAPTVMMATVNAGRGEDSIPDDVVATQSVDKSSSGTSGVTEDTGVRASQSREKSSDASISDNAGSAALSRSSGTDSISDNIPAVQRAALGSASISEESGAAGAVVRSPEIRQTTLVRSSSGVSYSQDEFEGSLGEGTAAYAGDFEPSTALHEGVTTAYDEDFEPAESIVVSRPSATSRGDALTRQVILPSPVEQSGGDASHRGAELALLDTDDDRRVLLSESTSSLTLGSLPAPSDVTLHEAGRAAARQLMKSFLTDVRARLRNDIVLLDHRQKAAVAAVKSELRAIDRKRASDELAIAGGARLLTSDLGSPGGAPVPSATSTPRAPPLGASISAEGRRALKSLASLAERRKQVLLRFKRDSAALLSEREAVREKYYSELLAFKRQLLRSRRLDEDRAGPLADASADLSMSDASLAADMRELSSSASAPALLQQPTSRAVAQLPSDITIAAPAGPVATPLALPTASDISRGITEALPAMMGAMVQALASAMALQQQPRTREPLRENIVSEPPRHTQDTIPTVIPQPALLVSRGENSSHASEDAYDQEAFDATSYSTQSSVSTAEGARRRQALAEAQASPTFAGVSTLGVAASVHPSNGTSREPTTVSPLATYAKSVSSNEDISEELPSTDEKSTAGSENVIKAPEFVSVPLSLSSPAPRSGYDHLSPRGPLGQSPLTAPVDHVLQSPVSVHIAPEHAVSSTVPSDHAVDSPHTRADVSLDAGVRLPESGAVNDDYSDDFSSGEEAPTAASFLSATRAPFPQEGTAAEVEDADIEESLVDDATLEKDVEVPPVHALSAFSNENVPRLEQPHSDGVAKSLDDAPLEVQVTPRATIAASPISLIAHSSPEKPGGLVDADLLVIELLPRASYASIEAQDAVAHLPTGVIRGSLETAGPFELGPADIVILLPAWTDPHVSQSSVVKGDGINDSRPRLEELPLQQQPLLFAGSSVHSGDLRASALVPPLCIENLPGLLLQPVQEQSRALSPVIVKEESSPLAIVSVDTITDALLMELATEAFHRAVQVTAAGELPPSLLPSDVKATEETESVIRSMLARVQVALEEQRSGAAQGAEPMSQSPSQSPARTPGRRSPVSPTLRGGVDEPFVSPASPSLLATGVRSKSPSAYSDSFEDDVGDSPAPPKLSAAMTSSLAFPLGGQKDADGEDDDLYDFRGARPAIPVPASTLPPIVRAPPRSAGAVPLPRAPTSERKRTLPPPPPPGAAQIWEAEALLTVRRILAAVPDDVDLLGPALQLNRPSAFHAGLFAELEQGLAPHDVGGPSARTRRRLIFDIAAESVLDFARKHRHACAQVRQTLLSGRQANKESVQALGALARQHIVSSVASLSRLSRSPETAAAAEDIVDRLAGAEFRLWDAGDDSEGSRRSGLPSVPSDPLFESLRQELYDFTVSRLVDELLVEAASASVPS